MKNHYILNNKFTHSKSNIANLAKRMKLSTSLSYNDFIHQAQDKVSSRQTAEGPEWSHFNSQKVLRKNHTRR